jgi:hypothetical protein
MAGNRSLGPVQLAVFELGAVNRAFRELSERIDRLKGLRGRSLVHDRMRVDDPVEVQDAITLGYQRAQTDQSLFQVAYLASGTAITFTPGAAYVEIAPALRRAIDFSVQTVVFARLTVRASGNEAGAGKGVRITDAGGTPAVTVEWNGTAEDTRSSAWVAVGSTADTVTQAQAKGSSATETLTILSITLELRAHVSLGA